MKIILKIQFNQEHMELLHNTPVQEDYSDLLLEVAQSLDSYSSQYLKENIKRNVRKYLRRLSSSRKIPLKLFFHPFSQNLA
jgi:hypothetical protein